MRCKFLEILSYCRIKKTLVNLWLTAHYTENAFIFITVQTVQYAECSILNLTAVYSNYSTVLPVDEINDEYVVYSTYI